MPSKDSRCDITTVLKVFLELLVCMCMYFTLEQLQQALIVVLWII